jgi:hypothetical protein
MTKSKLLCVILLITLPSIAFGDTFEIEAAPNPPDATTSRIYGIEVIAPNDIWGVGLWRTSDFREYSLTMHYDGIQWSIIPSPSPLSPNGKPAVALDDVDAIASDDVYAVGSYAVYNVSSRDTFMLHWDGSSWEHIVTPGQSAFGAQGFVFEAVVAIAENDVWFGGQGWPDTVAGQPANLLVHYDGSSFEEIYLPLLQNSEHKIRDMTALSSDDVWAVGAHGRASSIGRMHVARWNGSSWTYLDMPELGIDENLTAVAAIAADDVWVSGSYAIVDENNLLVYLPLFLHWDGSGWSQFDSPGFGSDLAAIESNNVYAVGGETLVHWDGQSWTVAGELDVTAEASLNAIDRIPGTGDLVAAGWQGFPQDTLIARFIPGVPDTVAVAADSLDVTRGRVISGTLADLAESDDADLSIGRATSDIQSRTEFEVKAVSSVANPSSLVVTLEGSVFARSQVNQTIELYDYVAGVWEQIDTRAATRFSDSTVKVAATGDLSRFVEAGTMCIEARIRYQSPVARQHFSSNTDQFLWTIGQ